MNSGLLERMQGPFYTIFTPFLDDQSIDYDSLDFYLEALYRQGARRFYAMAYNSRYGLLTDKEILEFNHHCVRKLKRLDDSNLVIVGDPIMGSTENSIHFALNALESGADLISILFQEKFFSNEQVWDHYAEVGVRGKLPIMVHEMPLISGFDGSQVHWPEELLFGLRKIKNVVALKEDSKNFSLTSKALQLEPDIRIVIAGSKRSFLPFYKMGARAYLNGISIIDAGIGEYFWNLLEEGESAKVAQLLQDVEDPFFDKLVAKYGWHRVNKAILEAAGYMSRAERSPMKSISEAEQYEVLAVYEKIIENWDSIRMSF